MAATPPTTGIAARTVAPAAIPPPPAASAPPPSHAVAAFVAAHPVSVLIAVPVEAVPNVVAIPIAAACPPRTVAVPVAIPAPLLILSDVFIFFYFFDTANLDAFDEYFFRPLPSVVYYIILILMLQRYSIIANILFVSHMVAHLSLSYVLQWYNLSLKIFSSQTFITPL